MAAQQPCGSCPATYKPTHSPLWGLGRAIPASTAVCLLGEGCCVPLREPRSVCSQDWGGGYRQVTSYCKVQPQCCERGTQELEAQAGASGGHLRWLLERGLGK